MTDIGVRRRALFQRRADQPAAGADADNSDEASPVPRKIWRISTFLKRYDPWPRRIATVAVIAALWPIVMTFVYAVVPPPASNLMITRLVNGNGITYDWVSLDEISPHLPRAVVSSEDARFCSHNGVDWIEFGDVLDEATDGDGEGPVRGASTISMQAAKNLFLWDGRSPVRKALELPLAYWMDLIWTKRRMIEIYLNIVEWAPGVYGAEAAAQYHFKKPAAKLSKREAALLAAVLPNPIKRNAGKPSKRVNRIAQRIMARMNMIGPYVTCLGL
ncbi:monofunctional biosynthetic peptidoglycan transglycosylase [Aestuariivirga sp. YIM B02566]|uniref:Monofunctional biosynthetic peptidoglycan transglycosylase n=1 Tax=Taklimakanibacter albus TaxID=2800327 RepID=A0ACC5R6V8_9HYPH|nr:monofunctional biosynthetic peptidoglycan transglycosylase [Aestuariivirga sp. YIM B02566]MBK1868308.1 monofunctional biosynthetic peptidoglycan transglycosylase [Aestuariivirga sp. YIM B02566]